MITMPLADFNKWLAVAKRGEKIAYHVGSLMYDRCFNESVQKVAYAAWGAAGMLYDNTEHRWVPAGRAQCLLVQRRLTPPLGFEYLAIKL
jgi:hypothetical protein